MEVISVRYKDNKTLLNLNDNGNVSFTTLKNYFPNAVSLSYKDDEGNMHVQNISQEEIIINSKVTEYDVYLNEHLKIETDTVEDTNDNNQQVLEKLSKSPSEKLTKFKTLRIGWLNKDIGSKKYHRVKRPLGGVRKLKLNQSSAYSADHIRQLAIDLFSNSLEDQYSVQVGFFDGRVLSEFELPSGEPCDLWDYCRSRNITPFQLNLFILTHPIYVSHTDRESEKLTRSRRRTLIRSGEFVPLGDVQVLYHYTRVSKYSGELSTMECRGRDLHAYFLDEQFGDGPAVEQFDPSSHGYSVSRIEKNGRVLLQINIEGDCSKRSFSFPSAGIDDWSNRHVVLHDTDELQGFCEGRFGIGFVPSCTCREALFTWYRDGELYRSDESLYWLGDVEIALGCQTSTFYCVVSCRSSQIELKSKEVEVTQETINRRLDYPY